MYRTVYLGSTTHSDWNGQKHKSEASTSGMLVSTILYLHIAISPGPFTLSESTMLLHHRLATCSVNNKLSTLVLKGDKDKAASAATLSGQSE